MVPFGAWCSFETVPLNFLRSSFGWDRVQRLNFGSSALKLALNHHQGSITLLQSVMCSLAMISRLIKEVRKAAKQIEKEAERVCSSNSISWILLYEFAFMNVPSVPPAFLWMLLQCNHCNIAPLPKAFFLLENFGERYTILKRAHNKKLF